MSKETDALLHHPEVIKVIRGTLRKKVVWRYDLEDAIADVQLAAWEWAIDQHPTTIAGWQAVCRVIARNIAISELRRRKRRRDLHVGLTAEADEHAPPPRPDALDPVDVNRALAELHDMHREGELPADVVEILDALQARVPATEVARELGVPDHRIHHHQQELRDRFRTRLRKAGLQAVVTLVGVAAVGVLGWHFRTMSGLGPAPVAVVDAGQAPSPTAPPPTALVRVDPRRKQIDSLLKEAEAALSKDDWKRCYEVLGALAAMDAGVPDRTEPLQKACADVHNREFSVKTK